MFDLVVQPQSTLRKSEVYKRGGSRVKSDGRKLESGASPWNILQIKVAENPI